MTPTHRGQRSPATPVATDPLLQAWLVGAVALAAMAVALCCLAAGIATAALLTGHGWIWPAPRTWPTMLPRLVRHPVEPDAWFVDPAVARATGPAWLTYACTGLLLTTTTGAAVWAYGRRPRRQHDTFGAALATRAEARARLSAGALRRRAEQIRPDLPGPRRRIPPTELGGLVGRNVDGGDLLYRTHEDTTYLVGPPRSMKTRGVLIGDLIDAPGAVVATSLRPDLLLHTITARQTDGRPVWVFDPTNISLWPVRLRWSPVDGCVDPTTAIRRAQVMVLGARDPNDIRGDADWRKLAADVLRCYLHAAALKGGGIRDVLRWAHNPRDETPVRILRESTGNASAWYRDLAGHQHKTDRIRQSIWLGVDSALAAFADPSVLDACTPTGQDRFDADRLIDERGTLYVLGGADHPGVEAITSALLADVFTTGKRRADHSPTGRLTPPLYPLLEEAANVALIWNLPGLMSYGGGSGMPFTVVFQSPAQARERWGEAAARAMWDAATYKLILPGLSVADDLDEMSRLIGDAWTHAQQVTRGWDHRQNSATEHQIRAIPPDRIRNLAEGHALLIPRSSPPVHVSLVPWDRRPDAHIIRAGYDQARRITGRLDTPGRNTR